jgi:predicted ABC-type transport system involved in lysophospholipase L1 biosynthesis ATPase subunit
MSSLLELRDVSLCFRRGRRHVVPVLRDVSLEMDGGETVTVVAQRAQGKTALLRVAAGMQRPDRGSVAFAGENVWRQSDGRRSRLLRGQIALVERAGPVLDMPVLVGIALPLLDAHGRREAYARARAALARVGADECARQHWSELADSERALVALAYGLACQPRLLLVDDLAATLGIGETDRLARLLGALAEEDGIGVLVCAGDSRLTSRADRIGSLAGGSLLLSQPLEDPPGADVIDFPGGATQRARFDA